MAYQPADVPTARAKTDSILDRDRTLCRPSRVKTRQLLRAATRNVARFDEDLLRNRDAQARAVKETLPLGAVRALRFASKRLVRYNVSPIHLLTRVVATLQRTDSAAG